MPENISAQTSENIASLLSEISSNTKRQAEYSRRQLLFSRLTFAVVALILVVAIIAAVILIPKAVHMMDSVTAISEQLQTLDLSAITEMAAEFQSIASKLAPTLDTINSAVTDAQADLTAAFEKLNSIDLKKLNDAISDLSAIIRPLANLFGR
ncbi:MAG: hypothetical protein IJF27_00880 [Oscillospiraceae bacterium]|nr:hypothetical protein [Oscillospiraceae bacterium]MBQ3048373.1 hypothetical protein [Oscillospiraceae bacterium]MBQ9939731.1 hypothetical protein [Oscillospiraceae bacterium]